MSSAVPFIAQPPSCASVIASLDDSQLVALVSSVRVKDITREIRSASARMMRLHDALELYNSHNRLSQGYFVSETERASEIVVTLPEAEELVAIERFSMAATLTPAPKDVVLGIISYMTKVLSLPGGVAPERISGIVDTLADHEHQPIYGTFMTGFSVPVIQLAVRSILETAKWFPTAGEFLEECLKQSKFLLLAGFAARRQAQLRAEAEAILLSQVSHLGSDDEVPF